ncbi:MAG: hypothetical protein K8S99_18710 [Planctomycetes bacterium]|nr:hypothetical protein [Planctomycetota bacterium]
MPLNALLTVWPILALLAYLLVTVVLYVLAQHRAHYVGLYDRIRESNRLRSEYIESLRKRGAKP